MRIQAARSAVVFCVLLSCVGEESLFSASASPASNDPIAEIIRSASPESIRFAVVGDFGTGDEKEAGVARMIAKWEPQVVSNRRRLLPVFHSRRNGNSSPLH